MKVSLSEIEEALLKALPADFQGDIKNLAGLIHRMLTHDLSKERANDAINNEPEIYTPVSMLTGKEVALPNATISFGPSNQMGDVSFKGTAGRDSYTINLTLNQPNQKPLWQLLRSKPHYLFAGAISLTLVSFAILFNRQYIAYMQSPKYVSTMIAETANALLEDNPQYDVLELDTYDPEDSANVGPISSNISLEQQKRYVIIISGTWSTWRRQAWNSPCPSQPGEREERPQYQSPARVNGNVGMDAAYVFARPAEASGCGQEEKLPTSMSGQLPLSVKLSADEDWQEILPDNKAYSPAHVYTYTVIGKGEPVQIRIYDDHTSENYGVLKIEIRGPLK